MSCDYSTPFYPSPYPSLFPSTFRQSAAPSSSPSITCGVCQHGTGNVNKTFNPRNLSAQDLANGLIAQLPAINRQSYALSCASQQTKALHPNALSHPCVIINLSPCGHMVHCLPATSWGNKMFQQKWAGIRNAVTFAETSNAWLPLLQPNTVPHNSLGPLQHTGFPMPKTTYIGLNDAFWIEHELLEHFMPGQAPRQLLPESFSRLTYLHEQKLAAEAPQSTTMASPQPMVWGTTAPLVIIPPRRSHAVAIVAPPSPPLTVVRCAAIAGKSPI